MKDIYGKTTGFKESAAEVAKEMAKSMMHSKRDVVQAIEDEELKDAKRKIIENEVCL